MHVVFCEDVKREMRAKAKTANFGIIYGMGAGISGPLQSPLLASLFGLRSHGVIFGASNLNYTIGAALGPFLTGYIFDITGSYETAFMLCAAVSVFGIILAIFLRPIKESGGRI